MPYAASFSNLLRSLAKPKFTRLRSGPGAGGCCEQNREINAETNAKRGVSMSSSMLRFRRGSQFMVGNLTWVSIFCRKQWMPGMTGVALCSCNRCQGQVTAAEHLVNQQMAQFQVRGSLQSQGKPIMTVSARDVRS